MNDMTNPAAAEAGAAESTNPLDAIKAVNFGVEELDAASVAVENVVALCSKNNIQPVFNFDTDKELPDGYGLAIIPLTKRVPGEGNVTEGACIAAIPSLDAILGAAGGETWVRKQITSILTRAVKLAAQGTGEDSAITSLPYEVIDFISSARASGMAGFNAVSSAFVKALKEKGLRFMSKVLLRQVLQSQAFAEQQFPSIPKEKWEIVLKSMIGHAANEGHEAGVMAHWLATRDTVEVSTSDIDLSDLDELVG